MARILTLTNWYPPHHFGGYEVLCRDVMTGLARRGHQIEVLCSDEVVPGADDADPAAFPVRRQLQMYWRDGVPWTPPRSAQTAIERANQRALEEALDQFRPDVVSVWHMGAVSLNLLTTLVRRQIPLVYAICDEWLIYGIALDPWSRRWAGNPARRLTGALAERLTGLPTALPDIGRSGCVCFLSKHTKAASQAASRWRFPVAPVIYPGIDLLRFPLADGDGPPRHWTWRLLYMGRLDARKGIDTLLRALRHLPTEATLSVLGRGEASERDRLVALATDLGVAGQVRFDPIGRAELAAAYRDHDCLVVPSEWPEPFGMVPLEAMACGTPVVSTAVGGLAEYLADGDNSLVFAPGDEHALAGALAALAHDDGLRRRLIINGLRTAAGFDLERTVSAYERWHVAVAAGDPLPTEEDEPAARTVRTRLGRAWRGWSR